jgi:hypothetical protein
MARPTNEEYRAAAIQRYAEEGTVEIDENAKISRAEDGAYVQAWVWVHDDET